jgi:hypothetical protein
MQNSQVAERIPGNALYRERAATTKAPTRATELALKRAPAPSSGTVEGCSGVGTVVGSSTGASVVAAGLVWMVVGFLMVVLGVSVGVGVVSAGLVVVAAGGVTVEVSSQSQEERVTVLTP